MLNPIYYDAGVRALHFILKGIAPFSTKIRQGLEGRRGLFDRIQAFGSIHPGAIWFHVASSGELEQAIPVMDELKAARPGLPLLLTYFSPSGKKAVTLEATRRKDQGLTVPWDHADYSPLDASAELSLFFTSVRPSLLVLVHRELWPGLLNAAKGFDVRAVLMSSYWPTKPSRGEGKKLEGLAWLGTVDSTSAERIREAVPTLPRADVESFGDPRAERVLLRKAWNKMPAETGETGHPLWLLASLHERDVVALSDLPFRLKSSPTLWVVVPHEPDDKMIGRLKRWLAPLGKVCLWSESGGELPAQGAIIVDKVGFLAELYVRASVVFVGGSYDARVHNVWEPAAYARPILTGPYIQNSAEALQLKAKGLLKVCPDSSALATELELLLADPTQHRAIAGGLTEFLEAQRGVSRRYAVKLLSLYRQSRTIN